MTTIDHSRRSTASACLRKYYWQYERNLVPELGSSALRYGSTWHGFMDGYYSHIQANGWARDGEALQAALTEGRKVWESESAKRPFYTDYRTFENCAKCFMEYVGYFSGDVGMMKVLSVEDAFKIEFPDFTFTGKLDLHVELNGVRWLLEHKTTGQPISVQLDRLNRSAQTIGYALACKLLGLKVEGILISMHQLSCRKLKSGDWGTPTIAFQRQPQMYTAHNEADWYQMFHHETKRIEEAQVTGKWVKNYDNCYQYGQCAYLPLCDQNRPLGEEVTSRYITHEWDVLQTVEKEPKTCQAARI